MTISPCAMLMTPITPKVMASPIAASRRTEPSERPYKEFCTAVQIARLLWIAAPAHLAEGRDFVGIGCGGEVEHDRRSRLDQSLFHPRIGFLGNGLVER